MKGALKPGIYLLHKPPGPSSAAAMRAFVAGFAQGGRKLPVCHGGTLDPFAEGLLLVLAGGATRLMDFIHEVPKRYEAQVAWGMETDTGDGGGKPVGPRTAHPPTADPGALDAALASFIGWTLQVPPATSAKKVGGEPAYKKAHRGESVVLPPSRVYLHQARWLGHDGQGVTSRLELVCRGGFYVRSLVREVGRALGVGAHVTSLSRTDIGPWKAPPLGTSEWLHGAQVCPWWPTRELTPDELYALKEGRSIPGGEILAAPWALPHGFPSVQPLVRALSRDALVALLAPQGNRWTAALRLPGGV